MAWILNNGDTLNVSAGTTISGVVIVAGATANVDGTSVNSLLLGGTENIGVGGSVDGIIGLEPGDAPFGGVLQLVDPTQLHATLVVGSSGADYQSVIQFTQANVTSITSTLDTLTVNYGTGQSVTWQYQDQGASTTFSLN